MPIKPQPSEGSTYEPLAAGTYPARLYSVIHLGRLPFEWQGQSKILDKVRMTFEFPTETKVFNEEKGEQPYVLSCEFTLSTHEKSNLRHFLEGWQGKRMSDMEAINTDLEQWVGKEGLANVVHSEAKNGNTYANIATMSPLPKGMQCPAQINPTFILNYHEKWDTAKFDSLPDFVKDKMRQSDQYIAMMEKATDEIDLSDIDL